MRAGDESMSTVSQLNAALAGRYEVDRELGAGGMATVYLARDVRHDRDVAIKVLHPDLGAALGAERFLAEIKTTAKLQHPHILSLLDSGDADGSLYYVMPVVSGESLRDRMTRERQLPIAEAVRIAREVAGALDYAHRHGVIHRDIKPENILLHDGSAIVADFGIALAVQSASGPRMTQTGLSLGTPQYMSPEQAMGERHIDNRADIYALGAVTYEMLTGDPPFTGSSVQAIVARVMTERPTAPHVLRDTIPPHLEQAVLTALEKLPADRFGSAAEFAAALDRHGDTTVPALATSHTAPSRRVSRVAVAVGVASVIAAFAAGWSLRHSGTVPRYSQKTFDGDVIASARFAPDGKTIVLGRRQGWDIQVVRPDYPEAQSLGLPPSQLLSISSKGELAVLTHPSSLGFFYAIGTLARVPLGGGAPRELLDSIGDADWSPDGSQLAIIRYADGTARLEFPIGTVLAQSAGWMSDLRMSPDGRSIAFAEHPSAGDNRGSIASVDLSGHKKTLTPQFSGTLGLAWSRDGKELYFSGRDTTHQMVVFAVNSSGVLREALNGPGDLTIRDVAPNGDWIVTRDVEISRVVSHDQTDSIGHYEGWTDFAWTTVLSPDGNMLALSDGSAEGGINYAVWLRSRRGARLARIGDGWPEAFSHDGKWVLTIVPTQPSKLMMYPTGAGSERQIPTPAFQTIDEAGWAFGETAVVICGHVAKQATHCSVQDLKGAPVVRAGDPSSLLNRYAAGFAPGFHRARTAISPDGTTFFVEQDKRIILVDIRNGNTRAIGDLAPGEEIARWSPDGRALWVVAAPPQQLQTLDVATGKRTTLLRDLHPPVGPQVRVSRFTFADDPRVYAFVSDKVGSDLYAVRGAR